MWKKRFWFVLLLSATGCSAGAAQFVRDVADFTRPDDWAVKAPAAVTSSFRPDGLLDVEWPKAEKPLVWEARLKHPRAVDPGAQRVFLKLFAATPAAKNRLYMILADRNGTEFTYTLPQLANWALNWRILDTYAFEANECGRMHPQVGTANRPGSPIPVKPMTFVGLKLEIAPDSAGHWLFDKVGSDAYALGSKTNHWGINLPLERYWMTTSLIQSERPPYVPLDWLEFGNTAWKLRWELVPGTQGPAIKTGEERIAFPAGDFRARERKLELGKLPPGLYTVNCSLVPEDLDKASPANWRPLRWNAEGPTFWNRESGADGSRGLGSVKSAGKPQGYVGWRQTVQLAEPGTGIFRVSARGEGTPTAWLTPLGRDLKSIGPSTSLKFESSREWRTQEVRVTLPPETAQMYVYLMATGKGGKAEFDNVEFLMDGKNVIPNGDAEQGDVLKQVSLPLNVIASTSTATPSPRLNSSAAPGEVLEIPLPDWSGRSGDKSWRITGPGGTVCASSDKLDGKVFRWKTPAIPGVYRFTALLKDGGVTVDRKELQLGVKGVIPAAPQVRRIAGEITTETDLFGPGKNYFTWSMYENHPDVPGYVEQISKWIADGRKCGFEYFRIRLDWNWVEPVPGVYDFTLSDRLIDEVLKQGGKVILEIRCEAPEWLDYESRLDSCGRADIWRHGSIGRIPSIWSAGMLDRLTEYATTAAKRYCDNPGIAAYHVWGLPGSLDWTNLDRPWLGIQVDYSAASLRKFHELYGKQIPGIPRSSSEFGKPDLSPEWRSWVEFRRSALEEYMIDHMVKPLRAIDKRRPIIGYFGLDFSSPKLAASSRELGWRRHTGGCGLIYQSQIGDMRALSDTGKSFPQEVHLMTPTGAELEQATSQLTAGGGQGLHWNYYWRSTVRVGEWTPERNAGLEDWQTLWRPLWQELRDAEPTAPPTVAVLTSWSTMQYLHRTFFSMRQDDLTTRLAAALYRDGVWPTWFSENAPPNVLDGKKMLIVPASGAQVIPQATADRIEKFVADGGKVLLFPASGRWVVEEPEQDFALLKRLGWQGAPPVPQSRVETEDGNSGFSDLKPKTAEVTFTPGSPLAALGKLTVNNPAPISKPGPDAHVEGRFADGTAAVLLWKHGKGEVLFLAGQPEWPKAAGFLGLAARKAGDERAVSGSKPYLLINDLTKGKDRYLIVHRLPDTYRPHTPELSRQVLDKYPAEKLSWSLRGLKGNYRMTEVSAAGRPERVVSGEELAAGIPVDMKLCQTRVFKLTPEQ